MTLEQGLDVNTLAQGTKRDHSVIADADAGLLAQMAQWETNFKRLLQKAAIDRPALQSSLRHWRKYSGSLGCCSARLARRAVPGH